jgi:quercetin dioxygenase-like cupin family protein
VSGCDRTEHVVELVMNVLPAGERSAFEAHVHECVACREELEALRPVVDGFVDWPTDVLRPAAPLWGRLAERIGAAASTVPDARWADEPEWNEVAPGIACKLLAKNEKSGYVSMLVRLAPGVEYPPHSHAGVEELHLLDGELWIDDRKLYPGDYNRAEPGTSDSRVFSETGCTCVLMTSSRDVLK